MKKVFIEAYTGRGENKVFVGKSEENKPESLADLQELVNDDEIVAGWWSSNVIEVKNRIRTGGTVSLKAKTNKIVAEAHARKAQGDTFLYDLCVREKLIEN